MEKVSITLNLNNMARKSKQASEKLEEVQKELERLQAEKELADQQEQELIDNTKKAIDGECEEAGLYCGVILTPEDVLAIVQLAIQTKENIKIPYNLYFKE